MNRIERILTAALALLMFAGCAKPAPLTEKQVREFFTLAAAPSGGPAAVKYYQKQIKPLLKAGSPGALERAFQYTGRTEYTLLELKGVVRLALLQTLLKAASKEAVAHALKRLAPALPADDAAPAGLLDSMRAYAGPQRHPHLCAVLAAGLMTRSLTALEQTRAVSPEGAQGHLADFRFALLALPEELSEVRNITRIVWQATLADVNEMDLAKLRNVLKGAYPGLFIAPDATWPAAPRPNRESGE